jgi:hypothetical protein
MKNVHYILEINEPGSHDSAYEVFESANPFLPFSKGDLINPGAFDSNVVPGIAVLEVVMVEHIIWHSKTENVIKHKLVLFTREVKDSRELRTKGLVEPFKDNLSS